MCVIEYSISTEINTANCCALIVCLFVILVNTKKMRISFTHTWLFFFALTVFSFLLRCFSSHSFQVLFVVLSQEHTSFSVTIFFWIFRTFFKRSTPFVPSFICFVCSFISLLRGFVRYIYIQTTILCLYYLFFNYYYFIKVLYYLSIDAHTKHNYLLRTLLVLSCAHENIIQNRWAMKSEGERN